MYILWENRRFQIYATKVNHLIARHHFHQDLEIAYVREGSVRACLNFKEYILDPGDIFIAFPNQIHSYPENNNITAYILTLDTRFGEAFGNVFKKQTPMYPIIHDSDNNDLTNYIEITAALFLQKKDEYYKQKLLGYFFIILSEVFSKLSFTDHFSDDNSLHHLITEYIITNYSTRITLDDMAKKLHFNKFYLSHFIKDNMHTSFNVFINDMRIHEACHILKNTKDSILNIALKTGYNSLRSFEYAFVKRIGITPGCYRKNPQ